MLFHSKDTTSCFIPFSEDVSKIELPEKLNFPFYYKVHPLCEIAANEVQRYLENEFNSEHNFGLDATNELLPIGKMFGVLVVEKEGVLGYLAAYSGKLANSNSVAFFVPPVFDMLHEDGYFLMKEKDLNAINSEINNLENNTDLLDLEQKIKTYQVESDQKITAFKHEMKLKKEQRKMVRENQIGSLSTTDFDALQKELVKQSLYDKHLLKTLSNEHQSTINELVIKKHEFEKIIQNLKEERKVKSNHLQQWLFTNYTFLNAKHQLKSLKSIFENSLHGLPPAGAGECCAPKLFQYAYKHNLKPVALAEFWWGQSPKSEIRKHKQYYPSCWGKCEPILGHMLQGLEVEENPFLKNPAEGKKLDIIYDDPYLVVVNKPAEFLSVPGIHISDSVYQRIKNRYPHATGPLIVHRLDMSTSGIMVLAKNKDVHENLQKQFIKRKVAKKYIALLDGLVSENEGTIDLPLRGDLDDRPRQMVCYEYGKKSQTKFKVLATNVNETRIEFTPITGRTHQLRMHSAHILGLNVPIKGDDLYGTKADRLHLHAFSLGFYHPISKEWVVFEVAPDF
ncbi:RNA pseudouridine synthase [Flavobacterium sp. xlx-214]|uniref:RluA family pseudouridine synthase n=1 Tax=unclassified Flavobacterium TaxID=196869 RepID=UPI0013D721D4|nr:MULTISPECIES: RluA family pseudouridine synthase [unclassified Flavobacterium]MBA5791840.1 RNA pseudouridine synthase [Flavobacterium sp. xlx-221]QMI83077.1 RNA pseudouridine synthase [Flavobacterium sp. xlx-214]